MCYIFLTLDLLDWKKCRGEKINFSEKINLSCELQKSANTHTCTYLYYLSQKEGAKNWRTLLNFNDANILKCEMVENELEDALRSQ